MGKPKKDLKVAIFCPSYKRDEYTEACIKALRDAQKYENTTFYFTNDGGTEIYLDKYDFKIPAIVNNHIHNLGLRTSIIEFFEWVKCKTFGGAKDFDIIAKMDNDCMVPKNWLNDLIDILDKYDVDILSPNVFPSNAAFRYGKVEEGLPYIKAKTVGGLWCMKASLIEDMEFIKYPTGKLKGSIAILRQIDNEKSPKIGWAYKIMVDDIGHYTGKHPSCIKTPEHEAYYLEVGRDISWG